MKILLVLLAISTITQAQEKSQNKRIIDDQMIEIDIEPKNWDVSKNKGFDWNQETIKPELKQESFQKTNN